MQRVNLVERPAKQLIALIRQSGDQIHMHVDVAERDQTLEIVEHRIDVLLAVDGCQRRRVRRLDAGFHLEQPLAGAAEELQRLVIQQVRADLKMKVRHAVVIVDDIFDDLIGALRIVIERSVDEFDLHHAFIEKIAKVRLDAVHRQRPHGLVD